MSNRTAKANQAVADAWAREQELVKTGYGTRDWTPEQQRSILEFGKAYDEKGKAFEGHHMKSVERFPDDQGCVGNIQFLSRREHLSAHNGSFQNSTNGCYDPATGKTNDFGNRPFEPCKVIPLSDPIVFSGGTGSTGKAGGTGSAKSGIAQTEKSKGTQNMSGANPGWAVTQEAVDAMFALEARLNELQEKNHQEIAKLKLEFEENQDGLGAHSESIRALIEELEEIASDGDNAVRRLTLKLRLAALYRQEHINKNRYGNSMHH